MVGLTQPLASITGESGMVIKSRLCPFQGRILCDGLLKAAGRLHSDPARAPLWQATTR